MENLSIQIGERLKSIRVKTGKTQTQIAGELGLLAQTYSRYEKGERDVPDEVKLKLKEMKINLDWLLTGEGEMFSTPKEPLHSPIKTMAESPNGQIIPYLDQPVSAGFGEELLNDEGKNRYICIPDTAGKKDLKALRVKGDSMDPTLKDGDIVVCDTGGWDGDGVYVIKTHEFAFVKRVILQPEGYMVISDNEKYPPYQVPASEDTVIIGKVYCAVVRM